MACGAFRPLERDVCEIKRIFVALDCRGRGYSKSILAELERLAADMDALRAYQLEQFPARTR